MAWAVSQSQPTLATPSGPVPREYWGMHIHRAASLDSWPAVFGSWRLWDAHVAWPNLEPGPGQWRFEALDQPVEMAPPDPPGGLLPPGQSPPGGPAPP